MLERSAKTHLGSAAIPFLNSWLGMMMIPACAPIDQTALVHALHRTQGKVQLFLGKSYNIIVVIDGFRGFLCFLIMRMIFIMMLMSSKLEPVIWSHDISQQIPCFHWCQIDHNVDVQYQRCTLN